MNTDDFVRKAKEIHGDKYDYSETVYINSRTKLKIICSIHGEFWQLSADFLERIGNV